MVIYLVTNLINGKLYVGQTSWTIEERWARHVENARYGKQTHLYRAIRKYRPESFKVESLAETESLEQLNLLERLWIISLRTYTPEVGYNMTFGGEGNVATDEVREKIRQKAIGRPASKKQKQVAAELFRGKPKSVEQRRKMAAHWTKDKKAKQSALATELNAIENKKLKDYVCPDCGMEFEQVTRSVYGGHRKACLYWQEVEAWLEKEDKEALEQILGEE